MKFPGMTAVKESAEGKVLLSPFEAAYIATVVLSGAARDTGNTGYTTTLRPGLILGQITADKKFSDYLNTNTDGTEQARGILLHSVKVTDEDGANQDQMVAVLMAQGVVKASELKAIDATGRTDLKAHNILFDDELSAA